MLARHRQPPGPMWPYVGILGLLFALSVTAPRAWEQRTRPGDKPSPRVAPRILPASAVLATLPPPPVETPRVSGEPTLAKPRVANCEPTLARPRRARGPLGSAQPDEVFAVDVTPLDLQAPVSPPVAAPSVFQLLGNAPAESAVSVASERVSAEESAPNVTFEVAEPLAPLIVGDAPAPAERLALAPDAETKDLGAHLAEEAPVTVDIAPRAAWLAPTSLLERFDLLAGECETSGWAMAAARDVAAFAKTNPRDLDEAAPALYRVWERYFEGVALAEQIAHAETAADARRACDALRRRLVVWDAALARREAALETRTSAIDARDVGAALRAAEATFASREDAQVWRDYLLFSELNAMNGARSSVSDAARAELAGEVLRRVSSSATTVGERRLLSHREVQQLASALSDWSGAGEDCLALAERVERYEEDLTPSAAMELAAHARRLAASDVEADRELSWMLNERFRNANVRLEFSADLISRLLPETAAREQAVAETILGVQSRGTSRTTTRLHLRTAADRRRLRLELLASGDIDSWTTASSGPAQFSHEGRASFSARRRLRFDRNGLHADAFFVDVANETELRGLKTDFDGLPLFGPIVRKIAHRQYQEKRGAANAEAERRIEERIREELMSETETALAAANLRWRERVVKPLDRLGVSPKIIESASSDTSAVLRVRLAADAQLGANTPRPRLPDGTLLSLQLHHTAINNALEGLDLNGRGCTLPELAKLLSEKLNRHDLLPADSLDGDVWVHFAEQDAVYARMIDGQIELNVRFAEFVTSHRSWHNFGVRVRYRPVTDGMSAELLREGPVELVGDSVHGVEIALRGIMNRLFPMDEAWKLTPASLADNEKLRDLEVSHFLIDDGWLSIGVSPKASIAKQREAVKTQR